MGKSTIETRTLEKAAEILGGRLRLARRLQVPITILDLWLSGQETPPHIYFLRAVDVVLYQDDIEPSTGDTPSAPPGGEKPVEGDSL